ncbi:MAG: hypothetical protein K0U54_02800 [Bacteroidetes bacterium]|nr:hypothetical protein [Bacteroidota bacterium]
MWQGAAMVKITIEGIGNASVRAAARHFAQYCVSEGFNTSGPYMTTTGLTFVDCKEVLPALIGQKIKTCIAEIHVETKEVVKIKMYEFPNTVNITIAEDVDPPQANPSAAMLIEMDAALF